MIERYLNQEINSIWDDQNKFDTWKLVQEKYVETLEELDVAENGIAKKINQSVVQKDEVYKQEEITNHDLASFVDILQKKVGEGSNWIHYGLTSSDIVDTANSVLIMQSLDYVKDLVNDFLSTLEEKAVQEKDTLIIGRTHGVYAEETFLGNIFGNWHLEVARGLNRLENSKNNISFGKLSGPVGNHSVVTSEMEKLTLEKLNLKPEQFANQIVSRDRYAEVVSSLGILASTYERIATNIRSYQRSEISEMYESFKDGQKGSSAMPHKKNPIGSERITGLARIMRSYVSTSLENMVLWNERDISNSSVERIMLPDAFHLISFMSIELNSILKHLVINYEQININLEDAKNKSVSQKYLSYLVNNGVDRDTAYRKIQEEIFNNLSAEELKKELEKEFKLEFPDLENQVNKNVDEKTFKDKFKSKFLEIREEVKDLLPNNEGVIDAVIAPVFFVVLANFVDLNTAIFSTGGLLIVFLIYRRLRKQDLKFVFYGFVGSAIALLLARLQGSASGFFIPGIIRDATIAIFGLISILIRKPFTIYSSKAFRNWPKGWYFHPKVRPAYTKVAIIWTIYLSLKAGLQIYFFNNPEILVVIKLATSNQSTLILLVISYIVGQRSLQNLNGPSVDEFLNNSPEPWISQQKGF